MGVEDGPTGARRSFVRASGVPGCQRCDQRVSQPLWLRREARRNLDGGLEVKVSGAWLCGVRLLAPRPQVKQVPWC